MNRSPMDRPQHHSPHRRAHARRRRGVAMLLVLGVVVIASVLGYAMLSSAAITKQANANVAVTASAQGIAESGVNLALYYLQNPGKSPTYPATPAADYNRSYYWQGTNGQFVDIGSPAIGSVKVAVTRVLVNNRPRYQVVAYGRTAGSTLERKAEATLLVNAEYRVDHAAMFTNDVTLPGNTRIGTAGMNNGDVYSNGALVIRTGGIVYGQGTRRKITSTPVQPSASPLPAWAPAPAVPKIVPTFDEVRSYSKYEFPKGTEYNATVLTGVTSLASGAKLEPTSGNPAGVYIVPGNFTMHSGSEVVGTLIVQGTLTFAGALVGGETRIRSAQPGFPAVIVKDNMIFGSPLGIAPVARIQGLTYVGGKVDGTGLLPTLDVRGALLAGGATPTFISLPLSYLVVNYDKSLATVPDFSPVGATPISVRVLEWQAQ